MTDAESEKRFEGAGQEFHAKYLGVVEVAKNKGQEVCQEAMQKLLVALKPRKEPKPRLIINLSYEGTHLKEMPPGINLMDMTFKHSQISYVWKDPRDQRSLGIVRSEPDAEDATKIVHKFHGIRTVKPAMPFLQEMQELFRIVKERSAQQKERSASVAAAADAAAAPAAAAPAAVPAAATPAALAPPASQPADLRDRTLSNLLGPEEPQSVGGLPKNASAASLDDLGDIFSASATITQPPPMTAIGQPVGGGAFGQPMGGAFGQPIGGGGAFGQPMGGGGAFGQPMGGGAFGQPMGGGAFGQPMGGGAFGQPMGGGAIGQPMGGGGAFGQQIGNSPYSPPIVTNPFGQPIPANSPIGQPQYQPRPPTPATAGPPLNPFGQQPQPMLAAGQPYGFPAGQRSPAPFPQQQQAPPQFAAQQQQAPYYQQQMHQQQHQQQPAPSTNPFAAGFTSVFDRQNSVNNNLDLLTPEPLSPSPVTPAAAPKPDAFGDLLVGLNSSTADPKRQQVSGKDLFKPVDKAKTTLRDLANQSPRP